MRKDEFRNHVFSVKSCFLIIFASEVYKNIKLNCAMNCSVVAVSRRCLMKNMCDYLQC